MGRPSLKKQRSAEILAAFERCVARSGVAGSTLKRIAEEAGVKRTLLRHYIGNREELVFALGAKIERRFIEQTDALFDALPEEGRVDALVTHLFHPSAQTSAQDIAIAQALITASETYPELGERMRAWVLRFDAGLCKELAAEYPHASKADVQAVSYGVLGIYFNVDSLAPLALPQRFGRAARRAAQRLIQTLEE